MGSGRREQREAAVLPSWSRAKWRGVLSVLPWLLLLSFTCGRCCRVLKTFLLRLEHRLERPPQEESRETETDSGSGQARSPEVLPLRPRSR